MQHHAQLRDADGAFVDAVFDAGIGEEVASDGFLYELRVGHIIIEGTDEVVAILVGVGDRGIAFGAVAFSVAHPVHEVACPLLAKMRRCQQVIHALVFGGWQTREDVAHAAAQRLRIGGRCGRNALLGEFRVDVVIDGFVRRLLRDGLKGPPLLAAGEDAFPVGFFGDLRFGRRRVAGVGGTLAYPLFEVGDDFVVELGSGFGHFDVFVLVLDGLHEQRARRIAGFDDIAGFTASLPAGAGVEHEAAFLLGAGAMAFIALLRENGTDLRFEELDLLRSRGGRGFAVEGQRGKEGRN